LPQIFAALVVDLGDKSSGFHRKYASEHDWENNLFTKSDSGNDTSIWAIWAEWRQVLISRVDHNRF
jgi:hypothetical protein